MKQAFQRDEDISKSQLALMFALAYLVYLCAKLYFGAIADRSGGRVLLAITALGSSVVGVGFSFGHTHPVFTVLWLLLRITLGAGWIGVVRVAANWVPLVSRARFMAFLSLAFVAGDATSRFALGLVLAEWTLSWQGTFRVAAGVSLALGVPGCLLLKERPSEAADVALMESDASSQRASEPHTVEREGLVQGESGAPGAVHATATPRDTPPHESPFRRFGRMWATRPGFPEVCLLSFSCTAVRETVMSFSVGWFEDVGASDATASIASGLFSTAGVVSTLLLGYLVDRRKDQTATIVSLALVPCVASLIVLAVLPTELLK